MSRLCDEYAVFAGNYLLLCAVIPAGSPALYYMDSIIAGQTAMVGVTDRSRCVLTRNLTFGASCLCGNAQRDRSSLRQADGFFSGRVYSRLIRGTEA